MSSLPGNFHSSSTCRSTYALPYVHHTNQNPSQLPPAPLLHTLPQFLTHQFLSPTQIPAIAHTSVSIVEISLPEGPSIHSGTVPSPRRRHAPLFSATRSRNLPHLSDLLSRHVNKCHPNEKPLVSSAPSRRKGTASASRATTSKQACDQCVQSTLPCDGANPCCKALLTTFSPDTYSSMIYFPYVFSQVHAQKNEVHLCQISSPDRTCGPGPSHPSSSRLFKPRPPISRHSPFRAEPISPLGPFFPPQ